MDNYGAFIVEENFLNKQELNLQIIETLKSSTQMTRTHDENSNYGNIDWFNVFLDDKSQIYQKFKSFFRLSDEDFTLAVFYYLEPGAQIHPHKDLSGSSIENRLRFHIPIITNKDVKFIVDRKNVYMRPGDLWILDTSYTHSVSNNGNESRIHAVFEVKINNNIRKYLPNDIKSKIHTINFFFWGLTKFSQSLLINSWRDPKYFLAQMRLAFRHIYQFIKSYFQ